MWIVILGWWRSRWCSGGRRVPRFGRVVLVVGTVAGVSAGVQGLEPVPGGGQVVGPGPAWWDFQDLASGVGDEAGWGGQEPEPQGLGAGLGQVAVQGQVAQPGGQRGRQGRRVAARRRCGRSRSRAGCGRRRP